ncbi:MAG TPA: FtsX-like permease family protein [Saprospiraceae bacterium]|nr:FtsX-like permease family protein [Saprospiraceae bacterium]
MSIPYTTLIAWRYIRGKKSFQAINVITAICTIGIAIGAAALLLILSVFNGFEDLLTGLYNAIYTDLKVYPKEGKVFVPDSNTLNEIKAWPEVVAISLTLEETALLDYGGNQDICTLKGVDDQFRYVTDIDSVLLDGEFKVKHGQAQLAILGAGLAQRLNVDHTNPYERLGVYLPNRKQRGPLDKAFKVQYAYPVGRFSIKQDYDYQYVFVSLDFIQNLLDLPGAVSGIEMRLTYDANVDDVKDRIVKIMETPVVVKDKNEQNAAFFKLMNIEKWISYAVVSLTLIIVSFNLVSALWMIVLEKRKDISILQSMGSSPGDVKKIFMRSGWLICLIGLLLGILIAMCFYYLQKSYGIVPIPEGFVVDSYPIQLRLMDIFIVGATVFLIGTLASWLPARKASRIAAYIRKE